MPDDVRLELQGWLPMLESYRTALGDDNEPCEDPIPAVSPARALEEPSLIAREPTLVAPIPTPVASTANIHFPIDGIVSRIQKTTPYLLGVGTTGAGSELLQERLLADLAVRCSVKTDRNALVIGFETGTDRGSAGEFSQPTEIVGYHQVRWYGPGKSKADAKRWNSQLADLLTWKQEFGMILFDLGDASQSLTGRLGRLCDGIVILLQESTQSRESIRVLKSLQAQRMPILGAWTLEQRVVNRAA